MKRNFLLSVIIASAFVSCKEGINSNDNPKEYLFTYDFQNGLNDWAGGFADYPVGGETFFELQFERSKLPANLDQNIYALKISGNNHSDDLFMFIKRKISNLKPNTVYNLTFNIDVASKYPQTSAGVGGSPGSSVYLKVGAARQEPLPIAYNGSYQLNIDKGNQSDSGADMISIGTIGIPGTNYNYVLINRNNLSAPVTIQSDSNGDVWVIIGTESGYEGTTTLYYKSIELKFVEK